MDEEQKRPSMISRFRTVHGRFLAAFVPAVLVIIAVFVIGFEAFSYRTASNELNDRMERIGGNLSIVLAEPAALGQIDVIRTVIANAINDRSIAYIRVLGLSGKPLAELSRASVTPEQDLVFDKPLQLGDGERTRPVGRLTLAMSRSALRDALIDRLFFVALLAATLVGAVVVVGSAVYKRIIVQPLEQLVGIINETNQGRGVKRVAPVRDDEIGDVFRAFNSMRDRQHRNELELEMTRAGLEKRVIERTSELKRAHDEALAASRAKSQFLANMSHEFRTPLNSIIGFSEILAADVVGKPELRQEYANDIRDSGVHLLNLINDLLDLSKAESGKLELQESILDIRSTIEVCTGMVRNSISEKGLSLEMKIPPSAPALRGDERKIRQMLLNLLSNAVKFTPGGGRITVSCRPATQGGYEIAVSDTGIGIDELDQQKILEPFVQVDSPMTRTHTGTGLGLPLVHILTKLHGGDLRMISTPGKGTTVTIRFPSDRVQYDARIARVAE